MSDSSKKKVCGMMSVNNDLCLTIELQNVIDIVGDLLRIL